MHYCSKSLSESNSASVANLEVLSSELEKQFEQSGLSSQPLTPIKALLLCKDSENISTKGIVSRIQTLHWKLLLVDIEDTEGNVVLILLETNALPQISYPLPRSLLHHLQKGTEVGNIPA